jgi:photosystem II stability/assembly factor-like uncharacterized protein
MRTFLRWWPLLLIAWGVRAVLPLTVYAAPPSVGSSWVNATGNLANMPSECGNLTLVSAIPNSDAVVAGVAQKGLWANTSGTTWSHLGDGAGSATITNRPSWIAYDPAHPGTFWESGIYNGGAVYKTSNNGNTFQLLGSSSIPDYPYSDYVSVDFTDPNRQTLLAGGHERRQTVWRSTNGGQSWTNVGLNLPGDTNFSSVPLVIDSQVHVVSTAGYAGGTSGIFRTTNGGTSWQLVYTGGAYGPPLMTSNGTIYWTDGNGLIKSTDAGLTWIQVGSNLQGGIRPIEMPDGTLAAVGNSTVRISTDGGSSWSPVGPAMPFSPASLTYSLNRQAFFISHWDCNGVVPPDAIMKLDYSVSVNPVTPAPPANLKILFS